LGVVGGNTNNGANANNGIWDAKKDVNGSAGNSEIAP